MASSERDAHVEERAGRILRDDDAAAAYAAFFEAQLRYCRMRLSLLTGLRRFARILMVGAVALLSAGSVLSLAFGPPPLAETPEETGW